jgi:hypothetical protein
VDITRAGLAEITEEERLQRLEEMMGEVDALLSKLQQAQNLPFGHLQGAEWVYGQLTSTLCFSFIVQNGGTKGYVRDGADLPVRPVPPTLQLSNTTHLLIQILCCCCSYQC